LGESIVRPQALQHGRRGEAADGVFAGTIQKIAAAEPTVNVTIEQLENFRRKIAGVFAFHRSHSSSGQVCLRQL